MPVPFRPREGGRRFNAKSVVAIVVTLLTLTATGGARAATEGCTKYCYMTEAAADEYVETYGAWLRPGWLWTGTKKRGLEVDSASCTGLLRYGWVRINESNIVYLVVTSSDETDAWDGGDGWPVGEKAYKKFRCIFTDARGRGHTGVYDAVTNRFVK